MEVITKRQVAALTLAYALVRGVVERVKPESPAEESNVDTVVFNAIINASEKCCGCAAN